MVRQGVRPGLDPTPGDVQSSGSGFAQGSSSQFDEEWRDALTSGEARRFAYPDRRRDQQVALMEYVRARQVVDLLREAGITAGRVLEYGCGSASMSIYLGTLGYRTFALDRSLSGLHVARLNQAMHAGGSPPLPVLVGDAMQLPMADGTFDVVMSYGLLEHFDDANLDRLLADVIRVLKPGGLFVADIVPFHYNARFLGSLLNFGASALYSTMRGRVSRVRELREHYFERYFESSHSPARWRAILRARGLEDVRVQVGRPFPALAISGRLERWYTRLMRRLLPFWRWFDASPSALTEAWGWMYLASGRKPG